MPLPICWNTLKESDPCNCQQHKEYNHRKHRGKSRERSVVLQKEDLHHGSTESIMTPTSHQYSRVPNTMCWCWITINYADKSSSFYNRGMLPQMGDPKALYLV